MECALEQCAELAGLDSVSSERTTARVCALSARRSSFFWLGRALRRPQLQDPPYGSDW
jgi:hypothetical protein